MRRWMCVPMIALCLLTAGCGGASSTEAAEAAREPFRTSNGCTMEAEVTCSNNDKEIRFTLKCTEDAEETATVEVLAPETVAGVKATVSGDALTLTYDDACLNAGTLSDEELSPAVCLPRLLSALRSGWLLEQNREKLDGTPCLRLSLDQTGKDGNKIVSTVWLREDDNTPLLGEIAVENEIILRAEFTSFSFGDILKN